MNIKRALLSRMPLLARLDRRQWVGPGVVSCITLLGIVVMLSWDFNKLPDMGAIEHIPTRKATFFNYLAPIVKLKNEEIRSQRDHLLNIATRFENSNSVSIIDRYRLKSLAQQYDVEWLESDSGAVIKTLRRRIDVVPVPLVLVQAAKESGWGTSRFARQGNNLFGQWCYRPGCGMVPAQRSGGAKHEVKEFNSIEDAIGAYLHNINTGDAYQSLRQIRARLRNAGKHPDGRALADGLLYYSQRREAYVNEVKDMLQQYHQFQQRQQQ